MQPPPTSVFIVNVILVSSLLVGLSTSICTSLRVSPSLLPGMALVVSGPAAVCSCESKSVHSTEDVSCSIFWWMRILNTFGSTGGNRASVGSGGGGFSVSGGGGGVFTDVGVGLGSVVIVVGSSGSAQAP